MIEDTIRSNRYFTATRINSLYSNFENLKHLNPEGYEANVNAWSDLLVQLLRKGCFLPVSGLSIPTTNPNLSHILSITGNGSPKGMGLVLSELVKQNVLVPFSKYRQFSESYYTVLDRQSGSIMDYVSVSKWISWGAEQVGLRGDFVTQSKNGDLITENYINWSYLTEKGLLVEDIFYGPGMNNYSDQVFDVEQFQDKINNSSNMGKLSRIDLDIILLFLSRDRNSCFYDGSYIKFYPSLSNKQNLVISEQDKSLVSLKRGIEALEVNQLELEAKIAEVNSRMKSLDPTADLTRSSLKKLLQLRKLFTKSYEKRSDSILNLHNLLISINDANNNLNMIDLLEESNSIMKSLTGKVDQDKIHDLMDEIDEYTQITDEVSDTLGNRSELVDSEVEEEFKEMEEEARRNQLGVLKEREEKDDPLISKLKDLNIKQSDLPGLEIPKSVEPSKQAVPN